MGSTLSAVKVRRISPKSAFSILIYVDADPDSPCRHITNSLRRVFIHSGAPLATIPPALQPISAFRVDFEPHLFLPSPGTKCDCEMVDPSAVAYGNT
jgi:hypothetical protein